MGQDDGKDRWWVYMIACRGGRIYTGTARDPEARFRVHKAGKGAAFTRANPPIALLRCVSFASRSQACRAEADLKRMSRAMKLRWASRAKDDGNAPGAGGDGLGQR